MPQQLKYHPCEKCPEHEARIRSLIAENNRQDEVIDEECARRREAESALKRIADTRLLPGSDWHRIADDLRDIAIFALPKGTP